MAYQKWAAPIKCIIVRSTRKRPRFHWSAEPSPIFASFCFIFRNELNFPFNVNTLNTVTLRMTTRENCPTKHLIKSSCTRPKRISHQSAIYVWKLVILNIIYKKCHTTFIRSNWYYINGAPTLKKGGDGLSWLLHTRTNCCFVWPTRMVVNRELTLIRLADRGSTVYTPWG